MLNKNSFVYFLTEGIKQSDKKYMKLCMYIFIVLSIYSSFTLMGVSKIITILVIMGVILFLVGMYIKSLLLLHTFLTHKRYNKDDWYLSGLSEMPFMLTYLKLAYREEYNFYKSLKLCNGLDYSRINFNRKLKLKDIQKINKITSRYVKNSKDAYSLLDSIHHDIKYQDKINDLAREMKRT